MAKPEIKKEVTLDVHYIKNNDFKTVLATGIIGGITPNGLIDMNFFIDRIPIPQKVTHSLSGGSLGTEIRKDSKKGIIREVNFGVVLDFTTAKSMLEWLDTKVKELESLKQKER